MALLHLGIFHSKLVAGRVAVLGKIDLHAVAGRLDVADIDESGERGGPETRDGAAAGVERQVVAGALVVPARRHDPGVLVVEVALLRARRGGLVPGMALVDRIAERVGVDKGFAAFLPVVVIGAAEQNADAEIDVDQVCW